jgi:hypothetical protein
MARMGYKRILGDLRYSVRIPFASNTILIGILLYFDGFQKSMNSSNYDSVGYTLNALQ